MFEYTVFYKILLPEEWNQFQITKEFKGTDGDLKDGYIHMCKNEEQLLRIINKYFNNKDHVVIKLDPLKMPNVIFEPISNGDLYPHLYEPLKISYILE